MFDYYLIVSEALQFLGLILFVNNFIRPRIEDLISQKKEQIKNINAREEELTHIKQQAQIRAQEKIDMARASAKHIVKDANIQGKNILEAFKKSGVAQGQLQADRIVKKALQSSLKEKVGQEKAVKEKTYQVLKQIIKDNLSPDIYQDIYRSAIEHIKKVDDEQTG